jgi:hypothetical protein
MPKAKAFLSPASLETQRSQREEQDPGVRNQESGKKNPEGWDLNPVSCILYFFPICVLCERK